MTDTVQPPVCAPPSTRRGLRPFTAAAAALAFVLTCFLSLQVVSPQPASALAIPPVVPPFLAAGTGLGAAAGTGAAGGLVGAGTATAAGAVAVPASLVVAAGAVGFGIGTLGVKGYAFVKDKFFTEVVPKVGGSVRANFVGYNFLNARYNPPPPGVTSPQYLFVDGTSQVPLNGSAHELHFELYRYPDLDNRCYITSYLKNEPGPFQWSIPFQAGGCAGQPPTHGAFVVGYPVPKDEGGFKRDYGPRFELFPKGPGNAWTLQSRLTCQNRSGGERVTEKVTAPFETLAEAPDFTPEIMCANDEHPVEYTLNARATNPDYAPQIITLITWTLPPTLRDPAGEHSNCFARAGSDLCVLTWVPKIGHPRGRECAWKNSTTAVPLPDEECAKLEPKPDPNPPEKQSGECYPNGWEAANPVEWVLRPVKCALEWAFVPSTSGKERVKQVHAEFTTKPPFSAIGGFFVGVSSMFGGWRGGCDSMPTFATREDKLASGDPRLGDLPCAPPDSPVWRAVYGAAQGAIVLGTGMILYRWIVSSLGRPVMD